MSEERSETGTAHEPDDDAIPEVPPDASTSVTLRRAALWTPFVTFAAGIGLLLASETVVSIVPQIQEGLPLAAAVRGVALALLFVSIPVGVIGWRIYLHRQPLPPIQFFSEFVELPRSLHGGRTRRVSYRDILSLHIAGKNPFLRVLIESRARVFHFPQNSFVDPRGPELVFREVRRRMMLMPDGDQLLVSISQRQAIAAETLSARPIATQALLGLLVVFFLNQSMLGSFDHALSAIRWGALSGPLVLDGELYRLLSASFLHGHWLHLIVNGIALYSLGGVMERLLGLPRYLVLYLVSGLGATIASALAGVVVSVGASGAIFGLFGGLAVVNWRYRSWLPFPFRQSLTWWVFIIGINAMLPILLPIIDVAAHAAGFVVGGAVTWFIIDRSRDLMPAPPPTTGVRVLSLVLSVTYLVGLGTSVYYAATSDRTVEVELARRVALEHPQYLIAYIDDLEGSQDMDLVRRVINRDETDPRILNDLAWSLAISADSNEEKLGLAEAAAHRFMRDLPDVSSLQDTYATVMYRRGQLDEAVRVQRLVVERKDTSNSLLLSGMSRDAEQIIYASQLARFLSARYSQTGALLPTGVEESAMILSVRGPEANAKKGPANRASIVVKLGEPFDDGLFAYAIANRGDELVGLFRLELGAEPGGRYSFSPDTRIDLERGVEFHLVLLEASSTLAPSEQSWKFWAMDPTIAAYP